VTFKYFFFSHRVSVFTAEDLQRNFLPVLQKLYQQEESMPFREPVDPLQLGIPDYLDIIKQPMDLSTIKGKLNSGQYSDPWSFVDDVWLMFDNAWLLE
jgi:E1A/CREB-binding protein